MPRKIITSKDGKFSIKTEGFSGSACKDATKNLERILGVVSSDESTSEMYDGVQEQTRSNV